VVKGPIFSKYRSFIQNCLKILPHQALHATELGFTHPVSGKKMSFEVPLPPAFQSVLEKWNRYTGANENEDS